MEPESESKRRSFAERLSRRERGKAQERSKGERNPSPSPSFVNEVKSETKRESVENEISGTVAGPTPTPSILSYNVNSLSYYATDPSGIKRRQKVLSCLKDFILKGDILCIQETNLAKKEIFALSNLKGCNISRNNFALGSATLIIDSPSLCSNYRGVDLPLPAVCQGFVQARR